MAPKNDNIPFNRLRQILLDLGFTERVIPGEYPYLFFKHAPSDTVAVYRN